MNSKPKKTNFTRATRLNLLILPDICVDLIFSYLSYDEVAKLRMVCKQLDEIAKRILNKGFANVEKYHGLCLKKVKGQLPRRESERRNHPLARHCDVLTAVETRLSLLNMTFMKYIDMSFCCFIPGKVLDEIFRVLRFIQTTKTPPRAHETLQELRDISSMAMEYFDEKIVPSFKGTNCVHAKFGSTNGTFTYFPTHQKLKQTLEEIVAKQKKATLAAIKSETKPLLEKVNKLSKKVEEMRKALDEQDSKINDINRRFLEYDQKFSVLIEEARCPQTPSASGVALKHKLPEPTPEPVPEPVVQTLQVSQRAKRAYKRKGNAKQPKSTAAKRTRSKFIM